MSKAVTKGPEEDIDKTLRFGHKVNWLVAELIVVIMGVVLGLAFSAWWQNYQDQKDSALSLARLSDNLAMTLLDLQADIGLLEQSAAAARMLLNSNASELTPESSASALARIFNTREPVAVSAEYKALTSTGRLRDIRNPKVVTAVTSIYEQLPYLMRLADGSDREASELKRKVAMSLIYREVAPFNLDMPTFTLHESAEEVLARADVRAQIVSAGFLAAFQAERYRIVISEITEVIAEIENELR